MPRRKLALILAGLLVTGGFIITQASVPRTVPEDPATRDEEHHAAPEQEPGGRGGTMDNHHMGQLLASWVENLEGSEGRWAFEYDGVPMLVVTDEAHNRMRMIAPVADASELEPERMRTLLEANFDRALDAKYSIFRDTVWSCFTHPLHELGEGELEEALHQVARLRQNYGGSYASTDLVFGGSSGTPTDRDDEPE
ncbi:MAG: hypothetical protein ACE5HU_05760 [Acidobacteriota bacterium]